MKQIVVKILAFLFCIDLSGCKSIYYIPNPVNTSTLSKRKDKELTATLGVSHLAVQSGYSPINHLQISASCNFLKYNLKAHPLFADYDERNLLKQNAGEIMLGTYMNAHSKKIRYTYNLHGGYTFTDVKKSTYVYSQQPHFENQFSYSVHRYFLQTGVAMVRKKAELGVSFKKGIMYYLDFKTLKTSYNEPKYKYSFSDLAAWFSYGKKIKFLMQGNIEYFKTFPDDPEYLWGITMNFGVKYIFNNQKFDTKKAGTQP